jgi:molybdenum cofactor cytidylyltransferase
MGAAKQLLKIHNETLLAKAISSFHRIKNSRKLIILGSGAAELIPHVEQFRGCEYVINRGWKKGIGSSIKEGLTFAVDSWPDTDAVVYLVCDQPGVSEHHLQQLITAYQNSNALIVASRYNYTDGVPALFDKKLFKEILSIDDAHGAKKVIASRAAGTEKILIDFPAGAIDLDTPDDVNTFIGK